MLVRIWTCTVNEGQEPLYLAFAQERSRWMFLRQPGCLGVLFIDMGDGRHAVHSFWQSKEDIDALQHSHSYQDTSAALKATGVLKDVSEVAVFPVEGGTIHQQTFTHGLTGSHVKVIVT